ncbi:MAG: RHS repeat protein [Clostridiaceae bacterium]|nr:RHS repeat protein [Clostridiaceae bacterium]
MYLIYPYRDPYPLVSYEYNENKELVKVYDAMGVPYRFCYRNSLLIQHTDRNGLSFYYDYDDYSPEGKCIHAWGDGGLYDYHFVYREDEKITEVTDSLGNVSYLKYDECYMIIEDKDPLGGITSYEYDDVGRTTAVVDADGNRTEYYYDKRGNLLKLSRPDGNSISTEFDDANKPNKIIDPNGAIWQQEWDSRGLLLKQTSPIGAETRYSYDEHGQPVCFTDPLKAETKFLFDDYGNLAAITDALGNTSKYTYNLMGDITSRIDSLGKKINYEYDPNGRLTKVLLPGGATVSCSYDAEDNLISIKDENSSETSFEYCGLGEIKRRIQPDGGIVEYHYDTEENLTAITNQRGERYELRRDALGRIISEIDYWGQERKYVFSAAGHLRESIDPLGRVIKYKTDPLGRILEKLLPDPFEHSKFQTETFQYDPNGNLIACENAIIRVEWDYDSYGQMLKEHQGEECVVSNIYDLDGNRTQRTTSIQFDGRTYSRTINYSYDVLGQVTSIYIPGHDPLQFSRNALGQLTHEILSKNLKRRFDYSEEGHLTAQKVLNSEGSVFEQRYSYDKAGNLIQKNDSVYGIDKFTYDPMGRIISHLNPEGKIKRYMHDPGGDLMSTKAESNGEKWIRKGEYEDICYHYDRVGNLISRKSENDETKFVWYANQRLIESVTNECKTIYHYDPLGRRIRKETDGKVTKFCWDEDTLLGDMSCTQIREWVYYPYNYEPLAMLISEDISLKESLYLYNNDPNGCPNRLISENGKVVWAAEFDAIGKVERLLINIVDNPLRMQGQYFDEETGLYYNRYRYFEPRFCAYISQDFLGLDAGENIYLYALNIWKWIDPLGLRGNPAKATHIHYVGIDKATGKPYSGYASMPGKHKGIDVLKYRYNNDFGRFQGQPTVEYTRYGKKGKAVARGLEQRDFEKFGGLDGTANKQNPVGKNNRNRSKYLNAADNHLKKKAKPKLKIKKICKL